MMKALRACGLFIAFAITFLPIYAHAQWTEPVRLTDHLNGLCPRAVVVGDTIHAVSSGLDFYYLKSIDGGRSWTEPISITDTIGYVWSGDIISSSNMLHIAWVGRHPDYFRIQLFHRSSTDGGASWSEPHRVFNHGGGMAMLKYPRFAASEDMLFISCRTIAELQIFRSLDNGETWGDSTVYESEFLTVDYPPSLLYSEGRLHAVYQQSMSGSYIEIYHRHSDDYGLTWSPRFMLSTEDNEHGQFPSAYSDMAGNLAVAWFDYKYGSMCGITGELLMRISTDSGQSWLPESRVTREQSAIASSVIIVDGETHAAWMDYREGDCTEGSRIYYSNSLDWGYSWSTPERITTGIESAELSPFLIYTDLNESIVLHCFTRKHWLPNTSDLFYLRNTTYTSAEEENRVTVQSAGLHRSYPNPFNESAIIEAHIVSETHIEVSIFDIRGNLVVSLYEGFLRAGHHTWTWSPRRVSSGTYFYQIKTSGTNYRGRMILIK